MYNFSLTICKMSNLHSQVSMMIEKWLSHLENLCKMTFSIEERALEFSNSRFGWCLHILSYLEPDILECQDKWVLRIITRNKATGGDGIPAELCQSLKDDVVKALPSICQNLEKLGSGHRTEKGQFSFNHKEGHCQRMFQLLHNYTHFIYEQSNAQNFPSYASTVLEWRTSRCWSWI